MFFVALSAISAETINLIPNAQSPTCGIQEAIDALPPEGGTVLLPEGRFPIECFIKLRSSVTLKGKGEKTVIAGGRNEKRARIAADAPSGSKVLAVSDASGFYPGQTVIVYENAKKKGASFHYMVESVDSKTKTITLGSTVGFTLKAGQTEVGFGLYALLAAPLKNGAVELAVTDTEPFHPGESIVLMGNSNSGRGGWGIEENIIEKVDAKAKVLTLKEPVWVSAFARVLVTHGYGGILAMGGREWGKPMKGAAVEDFAVEGWKGDIRPDIHHFFIGAVTFMECDDFRIRNVIVSDWHSDGISLQNCRDGRVEDSSATRTWGDGFHSGTASQRLTWERCSSTFNTGMPMLGTPGDGYFFCWENEGMVLRKCIFSDNAGAGVGRLGSSGGPLGDRNNTVEGCVIERNGKSGIELDGCAEAKNKIIGNTVRDNSRNDPGRYAGIHLSGGAGQCIIESNIVESRSVPPTQLWGIREETNAVKNVFRKNRIGPHASGGLVIQPGSASEENQVLQRRNRDDPLP